MMIVNEDPAFVNTSPDAAQKSLSPSGSATSRKDHRTPCMRMQPIGLFCRRSSHADHPFCGNDRIFEQNGDRHGSDAPGHGGDQ